MENKQKRESILIVISLFVLLISIVAKIHFNLKYNPIEGEILTDILDMPNSTIIIILTIINLFVVFISSFGTNILLNVVNSWGHTNHIQKGENLKFKIYLLYFTGYTILNGILIIYSISYKHVMNTLQLNILSILLFFIFSITIYKFIYEPKIRIKSLITVSSIFIINGMIPMLYLFQEFF